MEIAIIAHDGMKDRMVTFITEHKDILMQPHIKLIATGTTGGRAEEVGFTVRRMLSGPMGGDAQIAGRVAEGKTDLVLFFKDPLSSHAHDADINMLIRVCDVHNVAIATNPASAELFLRAL
jgi:methylglyoxal synthase